MRLFISRISHERGSQRVIIVHSGQSAALPVNRLNALKDVRREDHALRIFPHPQIIINRFVFIDEIFLPEGEAVVKRDKEKRDDGSRRDSSFYRTLPCTQEIKESQQRQNCRENVERHRRTEIRDRDERREKGAENAPDRPARLDRPHRLSVVGQISRRVFDEGRGDRSEQHKRKYEQDKAGSEGRPHKIISRYKSDNNVRYTEDHVTSDQRNDRDPDRREQDSPVEIPGIRIFIRCPASPDIADRHRDHDDADDHRPDHLGG